MSNKKDKNKDKKKKPRVNPLLSGFEMKIDSFGEIKSNYNIDKINDFLNEQVEDKKLVDRKDLEDIKKSVKEAAEKADPELGEDIPGSDLDENATPIDPEN